MKIIFAPTVEQKMIVRELSDYFYSNIFPRYFQEKEIADFERLGILPVRAEFDGFHTHGEAFKAMVSLQTLISILEMSEREEKHQLMFYRNVRILHELGVSFPFEYRQFSTPKRIREDILSHCIKPANQLLI